MTQSEQLTQCNRLIEKSKNRKILFTLKSWPIITAVTIGLCFLTKTVAEWCGVILPDQQNVDVVRAFLLKAFDSSRDFTAAASLVLQVLIVMPVLEEFYFRHFIYRQSQRPLTVRGGCYMPLPTAAILTLGALLPALPPVRAKILSEFPESTWLCYGLGLAMLALVEYVFRTFLGRLVAKLSCKALFVLSAALFSAAHYITQPWPDAAFLALFFFGLAQCWLYDRTHLWCAVLNHMLFNLTNLILLFIVPPA